MKLFLITILSFLACNNAFSFQAPNAQLTPGRAEAKLTKEVVCAPGYMEATANVPVAVQKKVYARYGIAYPNPNYGVDNLVDQGVGGSQLDVRNLWLQDINAPAGVIGFNEKNLIDHYLHSQVCSGALSIQQAQAIDRNPASWAAAYKQASAQVLTLPASSQSYQQYPAQAH